MYRRSGERTVRTDYNYRTNAQDSRFDPIPYGTVEGELGGWLTTKVRYKHIEASLVGGVTHYFNYEHTPGETSTFPFIGLTIQSGIHIKQKDSL